MEIYTIAGGLVLLAFGVWTGREMFRQFQPAGQPVRFSRMVERLGMSVDEIIDSDLAYHLPTAQRLCLRCGNVADCDKVLCARDALEDAPVFCPNAAYLHLVKYPVGAVD